jgi:hypothetical protein
MGMVNLITLENQLNFKIISKKLISETFIFFSGRKNLTPMDLII